TNNTIRKITAAGVVTTVAGIPGSGGYADGPGTAAKFNEPFGIAVDRAGTISRLDEPRGIAVDSNGTLYVADYDNHLIRKITSAGVVSTFAGTADVEGSADGQGAAARFRGPMGIAVDSTGIVYVADTGNRSIRRISADGLVTTVTLTGSALQSPRGIAIDTAGVIYVADYESHSIRAVSRTGAVTTVAGALGTAGTADGTG